MNQALIGLEPRMDYLRRLAVAFAVELRLRIITELYLREMSATSFVAEYGGGTVSRVVRQFETLFKATWLRLVRCETGGERRGGKEYFFRAPELAIFDAETWALLPYSVRVTFSWTTLLQHSERVAASIEAGTLDLDAGHHSCTGLLLDQEGWDQVIRRVDRAFASLLDEQTDARMRVDHTGEALRLGTAALMGFESPAPGAAPLGPRLLEIDDVLHLFSNRFSKVIRDELCLGIVTESNRQESSAKGYHEKYGGSADRIRRRFKLMEETTWLGKSREETGGRRRGAVEKFYLPTGPAVRRKNPWEEVPRAIRESEDWAQFGELTHLVLDAMRGGTFDMRTDRHCTWSLLSLDQQGWANVNAELEGLRTFGLEEQERAKQRMKGADEKPIRTTVGLTAVGAPAESAREP